MQIDLGDALTVIGVLGTIAAIWIGLTRRVDTKVGRKEFHELLERRDTRVQDDLKEVLRKLEQQNETSAEYRALATEKLETLSKDMAVLKDRAGQRRVRR